MILVNPRSVTVEGKKLCTSCSFACTSHDLVELYIQTYFTLGIGHSSADLRQAADRPTLLVVSAFTSFSSNDKPSLHHPRFSPKDQSLHVSNRIEQIQFCAGSASTSSSLPSPLSSVPCLSHPARCVKSTAHICRSYRYPGFYCPALLSPP